MNFGDFFIHLFDEMTTYIQVKVAANFNTFRTSALYLV